jgi:hypothetical protein
MSNNLHNEIKALIGNKPALVFSKESLDSFLLKNFANSLKYLGNNSIEIQGSSKFEFKVLSISIDPTQLEADTTALQTVIDKTGDRVYLGIVPSITAVLEIHYAGDQSKAFSRINYEVSNFKSYFDTDENVLLLNNFEFDVRSEVTPLPNKDDVLIETGITDNDLLRIEGVLAYVIPNSVIKSAFSSITKIKLSELFNGVEMSGKLSLDYLPNSSALLIIPESMTLKGNTGCPLELGSNVPKIESNRVTDGWEFVSNHNAIILSRVYDINPFAGIYFPKTILDLKFSKLYPSMSYFDSGGGFLNWEIKASALLKLLNLSIDIVNLGLNLKLEFGFFGEVAAYADVCHEQEEVASIKFKNNPQTDASRVELFYGFDYLESGKVIVSPQLIDVTIGKVTPTVSAVSRYAHMFGGDAAVVGYLIDIIIGKVLAHNIPIEINHFIRNQMNLNSFTLMNFQSLERFSTLKKFNSATFSGDVDSILVGIVSRG